MQVGTKSEKLKFWETTGKAAYNFPTITVDAPVGWMWITRKLPAATVRYHERLKLVLTPLH